MVADSANHIANDKVDHCEVEFEGSGQSTFELRSTNHIRFDLVGKFA